MCPYSWNGAALAALRHVATHMWKLGWDASVAPSIAPTVGQGPWRLWSWHLTLVSLWTQHLRDTTASYLLVSTVEVGMNAAPKTTLTFWACTASDATEYTSQWAPEWLLSQWVCSNTAYLTLQLRNGSGSFYSNKWASDPLSTGLWQPQSKWEASLNIWYRKSHTWCSNWKTTILMS